MSHRRRSREKTPTLSIHSWTLPRSDILLDPRNERSPWFTAPPELVSVFRKMQSHPRLGDSYDLSEGINTRGANDIYFITRISRAENGHVVAETFNRQVVRLEDELVYPLVQGKNLRPWFFDHVYALIPHRPPKWNYIPEPIMRKRFSESHSYLERFHHKLRERTLYSESRGPFYVILEISKAKVGNWKVAWADISTRLRACAMPLTIKEELLGEKQVLVDTTVRFVNLSDEDEAYYLCGVLNSAPANTFTYQFARPKGGAPFRGFTMWSVAILPVPQYSRTSATCKDLVQLAKQATECASRHSVSRVTEIEEQVNIRVARLYDLSDKELRSLTDHYDLLAGRSLRA
mgnify:CR=1 FL=1